MGAPSSWNKANMATPAVHDNGECKVKYVPCTEAARDMPLSLVIDYLAAVGYCVTGPGTIARLDRTAWEGEVIGLPGSVPASRRERADQYRRHLASDRLSGVPTYITDALFDSSSPSAPVTFLAKAKIHENLQAQPVTEAIPMTTETVDLNNLPALDTLPAMKVVVVTFGDSDKEHHYFAPESAQPGDYCVVYAGGGRVPTAAFPFNIGKIERETPDMENRARSAILGTFNETFAHAVQKRMDVRSAIMSRLQQKRKQFEDMAVYRMMAEKDPETAQLLEQLNKL